MAFLRGGDDSLRSAREWDDKWADAAPVTMRYNIYADENFPRPAVEKLRRLGHDVLTLADAGKSDQAVPDEEVLALAVTAGRVLVTLNRKHFIRLHQQQPNHAGIIVCTFDPNFVALAQRIDDVLQTQGSLDGQLLRVNRPA